MFKSLFILSVLGEPNQHPDPQATDRQPSAPPPSPSRAWAASPTRASRSARKSPPSAQSAPRWTAPVSVTFARTRTSSSPASSVPRCRTFTTRLSARARRLGRTSRPLDLARRAHLARLVLAALVLAARAAPAAPAALAALAALAAPAPPLVTRAAPARFTSPSPVSLLPPSLLRSSKRSLLIYRSRNSNT